MSATLVRIRFGSHLYGTSTPASDLDFKAVVIPPARDILLQRVQGTVSQHRVKEHGARNGPDDVDEDAFALHRYLALLADGQTTALDMLFAPRWAMEREPSVQWQLIVANRERLVSRRAASFVGYCRAQANRYGIRGSRVHAVREVVAWFDAAIARHGRLARLQVAGDELPGLIAAKALVHTAVVHIPHPSRPDPIPHLECCNRKAPFFATLKDARAIYARVLAEYGARALQAERNEGVDWKAVSHAVRVGREALEFLATGWITFPRPEAMHLLAIKQGELPYAAVAAEIEHLLEEVEVAQETSPLPDAPDLAFIDDLVCNAYGSEVLCDM